MPRGEISRREWICSFDRHTMARDPLSDIVQIRRFQIKFSLERDFYSALSILSDIKCPFSESNPGSMPGTRRLISSQWPTGPVPPAPHSVGSFSNAPGIAAIPALRVPPSPLYSPAISLPVMTPDPTPGNPLQSWLKNIDHILI